MKTALKFLLLVLLLNVARYIIGSPIEAITIMDQMHRVIPEYPDCFDVDFSGTDLAVSFFYNFMLWLSAAWIFYLAYPNVKGNFIGKSLKIYGVCCLFFISLAAVYMNHYSGAIKEFYIFSMIDAVIVFSVVALANGLLFPWIFKSEIAAHVHD